MSWTIKVEGIDSTTGALREALLAGAFNGVEKIAEAGVPIVQALSPVAYGVLANSVTEQTAVINGVITGQIFAQPPADVYAAPVETGTRAHFPPPSALLLWVKKRFDPKDEKEALSIAFAVAKNIAKRGTKGAHMFQKANDRLEALAKPIMEHELAAAAAAAGFGGTQ